MGNETSAPVTYGQRLLNSISVEWKKVETAHQFPARDGHCAAPIDKKLFVFGGVCWNSASDDVSETNDTLIFDSGMHELRTFVVCLGIVVPQLSLFMEHKTSYRLSSLHDSNDTDLYRV